MFLREVVQDLNANSPLWEKTVLILPSNRSIREFKSVLGQEIKSPVFSPKFFTIEQFIADVSGLSLCDPIEQQLKLYEAYQKINPNNKDDYTSFSGWANSVLNDFNEIDRYLIPPQEIFDYLSAIASIKNWGPSESTALINSEYTKFVKNLHGLYVEFNKLLFDNALAYQGMLYRHAVNNIGSYLQDQTSYNFHVIGLNALNEAEKTILNKVLDVPMSKIYWDMDKIFIQDKLHSAGYFIRQNISTFSKQASGQKHFSHGKFLAQKSIQITGVPKNVSQAKYIGKLLQDTCINSNRIALVLADETLLPAILNSIPEIYSQVNVTMGYPVKATQSYKFLKGILQLKRAKKNDGYHYKDVLQFLVNPISACFLNPKDIESFTKNIKQKNEFFIERKELLELLKPSQTLQNCFLKRLTVIQELEKFKDLFSFLVEQDLLKTKIEFESCIALVLGFKELIDSISGLSHQFEPVDLETFIVSQLGEKTLSFKGDPNSGLQIMGLLETRALDFDTVIMTSVNEGILPAGKSHNSFIPHDVKYEFGLPTIKEKDAVYTYHFYRLLQRAKNIHLVYNTEPDVLKGGEPSRFIQQLIADERLKTYVKHNFSSPRLSVIKPIEKRVEKTDLLIQHLKILAAKGFSPSSLAAYIRNPYDFYKQYVLGIAPPESVDENMAYNVLGSVIHDSLEKLYQPLVGIALTPVLFRKKLSLKLNP